MARYMYDSCSGTYPGKVGRDLTLGYVDGGNCNLAAQFDVGISSIGTNAGTVLDCEPGNLNAVQSVTWVLMRRAQRVDPTVYVAEWAAGFTWAAVNAAHDARGVARPWIWLAPWPNDQIPQDPQVVAVQFGYVGPYDISAVREFWPGVDAAPPPAVIFQEAIGMQPFSSNGQAALAALTPDGNVWVVWQDAEGTWHTANGARPIGQVDIRTGIGVDPKPGGRGIPYVYGATSDNRVWAMYPTAADWSAWASETI